MTSLIISIVHTKIYKKNNAIQKSYHPEIRRPKIIFQVHTRPRRSPQRADELNSWFTLARLRYLLVNIKTCNEMGLVDYLIIILGQGDM